MDDVRSNRKILKGKVISDKMQKTAVVEVERKYRHPVYKKVVRDQTRYKADNPDNKARVDDFVEIMETRPLSKDKRWRIINIIQKSANSIIKEQENKDIK